MIFELTNEVLINNIRFIYTIALIFGISRFLYYPKNGRTEYVLAYCMMSAIIFMICLLIKNIELGLGFAIGIFAIFGIIRFRTVTISTRDMTYLFLAIGIAAKNSLVPFDSNYLRLLYSDVYLIILLFLLERVFDKRIKVSKKEVIYTKLELLPPSKRPELINDLNEKYGFGEIKKIKVGKINEAKQTVGLFVTFKDQAGNHLDTTSE